MVNREVPLLVTMGSPLGYSEIQDRVRKPLQVPVTLAERTDATTGRRFAVADLALAPMTLGDYAVEVTIKTGDAEERAITAIRIGR